MPHRDEWQSRIKKVEREYVAMRQAADRFQETALNDPTVLRENLRHGEIVVASKNLEATYVVRLFAEFETGARQYWDAIWDTNPRTMDLLDGLTVRRGIPDKQREHAHLVRDYRNSMVHEREEEIEVIPRADARGYLCRFFGFLPLRW